MNICSIGHAEIAHENANYDCPICELIGEKDEEIEGLKNKITELTEQVDALREED